MRLIFLSFCMLMASIAALGAEKIPDRATVEGLIKDQLRSWESGDEETFLQTLHPEVVFAYPGKKLDLEGALEVFREWSRDFVETKVYFHEIIIEDRRFSVEYQFATTRKSDGVRTATGTVTVGHVEDGRLRVWKEYLDGRVSRLQATGELPLDEGLEPYPWVFMDETE